MYKPVGWVGIVAPATQEQRPRWEDGRTKREPAGWQTPSANVRKLRGLRLFYRLGLRFRNGFRW